MPGRKSWRAARPTTPPAPIRRRCAELLGEMTAAAALMQSNIKFNGALILQIFGDGPVKVAVAEVQPDLSLRATAKVVGDVPADAALRRDGQRQRTRAAARSRSTPRTSCPGQQPYQGVVPLFGDQAREAGQAQRGAGALHAAKRAARHHAGAGGRRQGGRGPADPAPAGRRARATSKARRSDDANEDEIGRNEDYNRIATWRPASRARSC